MSAPRGYEGKTGAGRAKARPAAVRDVETMPCPARPGPHWLVNSAERGGLVTVCRGCKRSGKRTSNPGGKCRSCRKATL